MFAEIDEEELPEFDIDEEEESESEAIDRMKGSLADKYADEMELILQVQVYLLQWQNGQFVF